ncbi:MAG: 8-amino-7-oxononanoate synthase [Pseudomonadales bacterium]|nr:8-amino-7-oxononanoate synthase [Pseudomonadales bacterium]
MADLLNPSFNLAEGLAAKKQQHLYRTRIEVESPQSAEIRVEGRDYLNFCSNDYLGLANHPDLVQSFKTAADTCGVGSGASHLINGHSSAHQNLELELAEFTGRDRALLFSTGYMANLGVISALCGRNDAVFEDRLNHASLIDAAILSRATLKRYRHNDVAHLEETLSISKGNRKLIVTDGVFSMDGDIAPMAGLATVAKQHQAWLMVDDAHGIGFLGEQGTGTLEQFNLSEQDVPVLMGTLGKALGTFGAFIAGSEELIETLIQNARTYIYTTALPPAVAAATRTSLGLIKTEAWRRQHLTELISAFRTGAEQLGLALMPSITPIQPLQIGDAARAMAISEQLRQKGFLISAIRPPTVPEGTSRLRITLTAGHSHQHIEALLEALEQACKAERET